MADNNNKLQVLVAGLGGASLGTEIVKSLHMAGGYLIYGCDISAYAYGHFMPECSRTFRISVDCYIESIIEICRDNSIRFVIPGGEGPLALLNAHRGRLHREGIIPVFNSENLIDICSDKRKTFRALREMGFPTPSTQEIGPDRIDVAIGFPCIIKPATGTGGSSFVFLVTNKQELDMYARYLLNNGQKVIVQEYLPHQEGEYTIGVLSLTDGTIAGSICLERVFYNKLSIMHKSDAGLISSGYTQGFIRNRPDLCRAAEEIARALDSRGPINIQGRIRDGIFVPFEINPRFSASTHLRSLAGFDEVNIYLQHLATGRKDFSPLMTKEGYCARSFTELFIERGSFDD